MVEALDYATIDDDDMDNALTLSICERVYEYVYAVEKVWKKKHL